MEYEAISPVPATQSADKKRYSYMEYKTMIKQDDYLATKEAQVAAQDSQENQNPNAMTPDAKVQKNRTSRNEVQVV